MTEHKHVAAHYHKGRPHYPVALLYWLVDAVGLTAAWQVADIGAGTGLLSELFLSNGNPTTAIEPDAAMLAVAQTEYPELTCIIAPAEDTTLSTNSVDLITVAQAFHWFDREKTRTEFKRILKPTGWVLLVWNLIDKPENPFSEALEDFWHTHLDPNKVFESQREAPRSIVEWLGADYAEASFANPQILDADGLRLRIVSHVDAPRPDSPDYVSMITDLDRLFNTHEVNGTVTLNHHTRAHIGRL